MLGMLLLPTVLFLNVPENKLFQNLWLVWLWLFNHNHTRKSYLWIGYALYDQVSVLVTAGYGMIQGLTKPPSLSCSFVGTLVIFKLLMMMRG